jgi:hypothetical protein
MKTIKGGDASTYIVPLPGALTEGLHLSLHPSGEIHLKDRDNGIIARVNIIQLLNGLKSGGMDRLLAALMRPPEGGQSAEAFVVPRELLQSLSSDSRDVEIKIERLVDSFNVIVFDDTSNLGKNLDWLRGEGLLKEQGVMLFTVEESDATYGFINVLRDKPVDMPLPPVSDGLPFSQTIRNLMGQLQEYGGIFFAIPNEDDDIKKFADEIGIGGFYDTLARKMREMDPGEFEEMTVGFVKEVEAWAATAFKNLKVNTPIRALVPKTQTERGTVAAGKNGKGMPRSVTAKKRKSRSRDSVTVPVRAVL